MQVINFNQAVRHGEVVCLPVDKFPKGVEIEQRNVKEFIIGHSETGHHHVLTGGTVDVFKIISPVMNGTLYKEICTQLYGKNEVLWPEELIPFEAKSDIQIKHLKSFDVHETKPVAKGLYFKVTAGEYDYFAKAMTRDRD